MELTTPQKYSLAFLVLLIIFWLVLFVTGTKDGFYNYLYSFLFGLIPFFGGAIAVHNSQVWGGLKSAIGKAVFFVGLGVLLWGSGELVWSYYNFFLGVPAPYPSLADLGFAPSIFFYGLGAAYLSQVTGSKFGLRTSSAKAFIVIAPIIILIISYYILVVVARGGVIVPPGESSLKTILDIAYPLGDFLGLTIAALISGLSFRYMGGKFSLSIVSILLGLLAMYIGDSLFSYATTVGTYYNANFGDLMLTLGTFLLTFGALGFYKSKRA